MSATDHEEQPSGVSRRGILAGIGGAVALGSVASSEVFAQPASAAPPDGRAPRDPRVEALLRRMTVPEKLGQLQLVRDPDVAKSFLAKGSLGGVFNIVGAAALNDLQRIAVEQTRLGIPLIFGLDIIHGYTTNVPIPLAQGASFDPTVTEDGAATAASEARRSGIHWTYAPMMDVSHEPRWGRIAEGNGEDPYLVSRFAVAATRGF
ncbi:MAG TPA: glycoside hydrolase family 3 N-terminal domain-containing protein, partial [Jatrophihabitantaceae bacterium]|nr:glycoside hydrolase family 3 N-terminal domain-containing protein [Jatrophihabitantaceae bacterium]